MSSEPTIVACTLYIYTAIIPSLSLSLLCNKVHSATRRPLPDKKETLTGGATEPVRAALPGCASFGSSPARSLRAAPHPPGSRGSNASRSTSCTRAESVCRTVVAGCQWVLPIWKDGTGRRTPWGHVLPGERGVPEGAPWPASLWSHSVVETSDAALRTSSRTRETTNMTVAPQVGGPRGLRRGGSLAKASAAHHGRECDARGHGVRTTRRLHGKQAGVGRGRAVGLRVAN